MDLKDAYNQVPLDEASSGLCVINTHRGLFRYNRLPFGIASAPAIFQRKIDAVLGGLPGVQAYLDDVLVSGGKSDNGEQLKRVLERLEIMALNLGLTNAIFGSFPSLTLAIV